MNQSTRRTQDWLNLRSKVVWRYGRYHHHVDYKPFRDNKPEFIDGYDPEDNRSETDLFEFERVKIN